MGAGALGVVGVGVASGALSAYGAKKAGRSAEVAGNNAASAAMYNTDESVRLAERGMEFSQPYRDMGYGAVNMLNSMYLPGYQGMQTPGSAIGEDGQPGWLNPVEFTGHGTGANLPWNRYQVAQANDAVQNRAGMSASPIGGNALSAISNNTAQMVNAQTVNPLMQMASMGAGGVSQGVGSAGQASNAFAQNQSPNMMLKGGMAGAQGDNAAYQAAAGGIGAAANNWMTYNFMDSQGWIT